MVWIWTTASRAMDTPGSERHTPGSEKHTPGSEKDTPGSEEPGRLLATHSSSPAASPGARDEGRRGRLRRREGRTRRGGQPVLQRLAAGTRPLPSRLPPSPLPPRHVGCLLPPSSLPPAPPCFARRRRLLWQRSRRPQPRRREAGARDRRGREAVGSPRGWVPSRCSRVTPVRAATTTAKGRATCAARFPSRVQASPRQPCWPPDGAASW